MGTAVGAAVVVVVPVAAVVTVKQYVPVPSSGVRGPVVAEDKACVAPTAPISRPSCAEGNPEPTAYTLSAVHLPIIRKSAITKASWDLQESSKPELSSP